MTLSYITFMSKTHCTFFFPLLKGLHYLHNSVLGLHGQLSSSNCTIDSRFVLKLTDFGLHEFNKSATQDDQITNNNDSNDTLNVERNTLTIL